MNKMKTRSQQQKNRRLVAILTAAVVVMFGFGFALIPLYNVLCNVFGINGKTSNSSQQQAATIDHSRSIKIQFVAHTQSSLDWKFHPETRNTTIHPGENTEVAYFAKNLTAKSMAVQAIPSVTPGQAANYLKKTECFCFTQQILKAGQAKSMPILFHLDSNLPKNIKEITLSYTLFKATKPAKRRNRGRIQ